LYPHPPPSPGSQLRPRRLGGRSGSAAYFGRATPYR